jgi:flagellar biosynthetic protein FlhB
MADDSDDSQKTEDPSGRKLSRARERGQVIQSRDIGTWFMLATGAGIVLLFGPSIARTMERTLVSFIELRPFLDRDGLRWDAVASALGTIAGTLVLPMLFLVVAAIAGTVGQTGLLFATEKFNLDFSRLSPIAGFGRLFSIRGLFDFLKSLGKVAIVAAVAGWMLVPEFDRLDLLIGMGDSAILPETYRLVFRLLLGVLSVLAAIAVGDYVYQRFAFLKSMRMSKQEVKEEHKQSEGDPVVRGRLRQIRIERARRRMMAAVPGASVVVTNPTHFAVALKYEMGSAGAPRVVAKGADLVAQRIREIAKENDVPIVENPPLARALYAGVEIDQEIPREHYRTVAEIISYVFRLKGKIKGDGPQPAGTVLR